MGSCALPAWLQTPLCKGPCTSVCCERALKWESPLPATVCQCQRQANKLWLADGRVRPFAPEFEQQRENSPQVPLMLQPSPPRGMLRCQHKPMRGLSSLEGELSSPAAKALSCSRGHRGVSLPEVSPPSWGHYRQSPASLPAQASALSHSLGDSQQTSQCWESWFWGDRAQVYPVAVPKGGSGAETKCWTEWGPLQCEALLLL